MSGASVSDARPRWRAVNPADKRWFIESKARRWRDGRISFLQRADRDRFLDDEERADLCRLLVLQQDDRIDELCMPEWAARRFRWS